MTVKGTNNGRDFGKFFLFFIIIADFNIDNSFLKCHIYEFENVYSKLVVVLSFHENEDI